MMLWRVKFSEVAFLRTKISPDLNFWYWNFWCNLQYGVIPLLYYLKCNAKESKELERDKINKKFFYLNQTYKQQAPQISWSGFIVFLANTWPAHLASSCTVGGDGWWLMHGWMGSWWKNSKLQEMHFVYMTLQKQLLCNNNKMFFATVRKVDTTVHDNR